MWVWAPSYYFFSKICISNKNENKINLQSSIKQSLFLQKQKIWKDSWKEILSEKNILCMKEIENYIGKKS